METVIIFLTVIGLWTPFWGVMYLIGRYIKKPYLRAIGFLFFGSIVPLGIWFIFSLKI